MYKLGAFIIIMLVILVIFVVMDNLNYMRYNIIQEILQSYILSKHSNVSTNSGNKSCVIKLTQYYIEPTYVSEEDKSEINYSSVGGMDNIDGLDGGGSGKKIYDFKQYSEPAKPYDDISSGKPDGSMGQDGGFGQEINFKESKLIQDLPDRTLGVQTINEQDGSHGYPSQVHGQQIYKNELTDGEQYGDPYKGFTYYYLENDNINAPCKSDKDCKSSKCSNSGFCKY